MSTLLHMSFRVNDPQHSAELYAELLDGKVVGSGPQLNSIGVRTVVFGDWQPGRLNDILEFLAAGQTLGPGRVYRPHGRPGPPLRARRVYDRQVLRPTGRHRCQAQG